MQKVFFILLISSGLSVGSAQAQAGSQKAAQPVATPSQAYLALADDCFKLLRKAAALPDAQGVALLRQQAPPLQLRARPVTQAYARWLKAQPPAKREAEENRIMHSNFAKELEAVTVSLGPKAKHSPAFIQQVSNLMEAMAEGL